LAARAARAGTVSAAGPKTPFTIRRNALHSKAMAVKHPRVEITYCTQCRWLLRAAWMAQELLTTFPDGIGEIALRPGTGGVFDVLVEEEIVWSRATQGLFPELKELKQLVRDRIAPGQDLGHSDR
jgi:selenoprotein W-related protein